MNAPARQLDVERRGLLGKIHIAKAQLRLDEDTYRDVLMRVTGKASAADCSMAQLEAVKAEMVNLGWKPAKRAHPRAGKRPLADGEAAAKLRALWISGYHLGVVRDPSESALAAFVKRATGGKSKGVDAMQWMSGNDARKAIEALKAWLGRDGDVDWSLSTPRRAIIEAQHRKMVGFGFPSDLDRFLFSINRKQTLALYSDESLDGLIEYVGELLRVEMGRV